MSASGSFGLTCEVTMQEWCCTGGAFRLVHAVDRVEEVLCGEVVAADNGMLIPSRQCIDLLAVEELSSLEES